MHARAKEKDICAYTERERCENKRTDGSCKASTGNNRAQLALIKGANNSGGDGSASLFSAILVDNHTVVCLVLVASARPTTTELTKRKYNSKKMIIN